ncbi:MAG: serine/threonine protein kinase [Clostridiales bacterium]|nr:serine/threonine protein kinase [Clostridiales bacterium]
MNYNSLCFKCFSEKPSANVPCPKYGHMNQTPQISRSCLRAGTLLNHRYIVGVALGIGGFGITYRCFDMKIGGICAVKEFFPGHMGVRNVSANDYNSKVVTISQQDSEKYHYIMNRFVQEAELLRTLDHKNIIKVYDCFSENNTAYYVMEYCSGIDLRKYTNDFKNRLNYDNGMNIMFQVMNGLEYIHSKDILHRDIAPDNIYVTKSGHVKILDFGAARQEGDQLRKNLSIIVKAGYAPIEQYGKQKQGSYTDIYALGASFYHLFTGRIPEESTKRVMEDPLIPFSQLRPDLPDKLKYCIERCMAVRISDRLNL